MRSPLQFTCGDRCYYPYTIRYNWIDLAVRCDRAAITVSRGAANFKSHAAQRVYREAVVFPVV